MYTFYLITKHIFHYDSYSYATLVLSQYILCQHFNIFPQDKNSILTRAFLILLLSFFDCPLLLHLNPFPSSLFLLIYNLKYFWKILHNGSFNIDIVTRNVSIHPSMAPGSHITCCRDYRGFPATGYKLGAGQRYGQLVNGLQHEGLCRSDVSLCL